MPMLRNFPDFRIKVRYEKNYAPCFFFASATAVRFSAYIQGKEVGHVLAMPVVKRDLWETHSVLEHEYHGLGIGVAMYATAINFFLNKGLMICSSERPSPAAKRVWKSRRLNNMFLIQERSGQYIVEQKA